MARIERGLLDEGTVGLGGSGRWRLFGDFSEKKKDTVDKTIPNRKCDCYLGKYKLAGFHGGMIHSGAQL